MTFDQLRVFVAVAERQHMTQAGEALNIAQSAVSATIHGLEERYDARLFDRIGRGIRLTDAGRLFLDEARAVLARVDSAELMLAEIANLNRGSLRIQASETIASYWLPSRLVAFRRAYAGIDIKVAIGNSLAAIDAVLLAHVELGFVEGDIDHPALNVVDLARDQLVVVVGADHPWVGRKTIAPEEFGETDWVLREPGSGTRSMFEADLVALGLSPSMLTVALELPRNEAVISAVQAGLGATAVSANAAVAGLEAGMLFQVPITLPTRIFRAITLQGRRQSHAASALLSIVGHD